MIPLVRPLDGRLGRQRAVVNAPRELTVALKPGIEESSWRSSPRSNSRHTAPLELFATHGELQLPLALQSIDTDLASPTVIERVWLQTWLANAIRQDRAGYRFRGAGPTVTVELPPGVLHEEVEVLLDGRRPRLDTSQAGRIVVTLPPGLETGDDRSLDETSLSHTLEVRFRQSIELPLVARHHLSPPQLVGSDSLAEIYWQIIAPGDQHLVDAPDNLVSTSQWQWLGGFWGRRAVKSQDDLEKWVGATTQLMPGSGQNEYLFSGLSPVASIEVMIAPRWLIVLIASAGCLALVLAWIYLPILRRGWILVVLALVLVVLGASYPVPAMLLGQASVLGIALSVLAMLIARLAGRPGRFKTPVRTSGSTLRQQTPRGDSHLLITATPGASTSPTASLHLPESGQ